MQKRLLQIDARTGAIEEGFVAYISPRRKNGFSKGWIAMSQENALLAIAKSGFNGETLRVLLMLLAKVEFENFIVVSQADMAQELGISNTQFSRSLKALADENIILRGPKVGRQGSLKLNPNYGWKGTAKNHIVALDQFRGRK